MDEQQENYQAQYKKITVRTSDGSTIYGEVNIADKQRVSDLFTTNEDLFIVMIDASLKDSTGKTMFINKKHIVWVEPEDI